MAVRVRLSVIAVTVGLALGVHSSALAAEAVIDGFTDADSGTLFVTNTNILQNAVGSTTKTDSNLMGVIGGSRELTVSATALGFPVLDNVIAGVVLPPIPFLEYASTSDALGTAVATYDADGSGLNAFLAFAQGVRLTILAADLSAVVPPGLDVSLTLTDGNLATATVTQTVAMPVTAMAPLPLDFAFSSFAGVDAENLQSIVVTLAPQTAGDVRLAPIETYGTPLIETICNDGIDNNNNGLTDCADPDCATFPGCLPPAPAPALSPLALLLAVSMLGGIAAAALSHRSAG